MTPPERITVNGQEYTWYVQQESNFYTLLIFSGDDDLDIEMPLGEFPHGVDFGVTPAYVRFVIESTHKALD
ncbi:MAG: hypothetical protein U0694_14610 [Anaerolineae bacterium]